MAFLNLNNYFKKYKKHLKQKNEDAYRGKIPKSLKKYLDINQYRNTHYTVLFILKFLIILYCYIIIVSSIYKYTTNIYFLLGKNYLGSNILPIILSTIALFALNHWSINNLDDYNKAILGNRLLYLFISHHFFDEIDLIFPTIPFLIFPVIRKFLSNQLYDIGIIIWQISFIFIIIIITIIFFSKLRLKNHVNMYMLSGHNYINKRTMRLLFKIFKSYIKRDSLYLYNRWIRITESSETRFNRSDSIILLNAYHAFYVVLNYKNKHNTSKKRFNRICCVYKSIFLYTKKLNIRDESVNLKLFIKHFALLNAFYKSNRSLLNGFDFMFKFPLLNYKESFIIPKCFYINSNLNYLSWSLYDVIILNELENGFFRLYLKGSYKLVNHKNILCKYALLNLLKNEYKYIVSKSKIGLLRQVKDIINKMKELHIISRGFKISTLKNISKK